MLKTLRLIKHHPLTQEAPLRAVGRLARWQIVSRLRDEVELDWFGGAKMSVRRGMTGMTGNIYCGLHEFADMAFVMHMLRPGDLFADIGANVGSYTILASKICGAHTVAVEPAPATMALLKRNVALNEMADRVACHQLVIGASEGSVEFTVGKDTTNRVAKSTDANRQKLSMTTLSALFAPHPPLVMKIDVEGYEAQVLSGAGPILKDHRLQAVEVETAGPGVSDRLVAAGFSPVAYNAFERTLSPAADHPQSNNALFVRDLTFCKNRVATAPFRNIVGQSV